MAAIESKIWHLENINILNDFTSEEIAEIDRRSVMRSFDKKVHIYFPNDPANIVFLLKSGRVKIGSYGANGKELIKTIIYPGEIFGELSITGKEVRNDFAIAMDKDVKLCTIPKSEMLEILSKIPRLQFRITQTIGNRVKDIERRFESMVFQSSEGRIINFLKEMAEKIGQKIGDEILVKHHLTHEEIGQMTCTSRQSVTTTLNELKNKNLIHLDRNKILIRDINNLTLS